MQQTSIGWTDFSANLLKYRNAEGKTVWACIHASEGCRNCYSETLAKRWGRGEAFTAENMKSLTPYFDVDEANQILKSKKVAGKKVFVDDMTDLFGEWVSDEIIDQHFAVFALRPDVTFQLLTKRAKRLNTYFVERHTRHIIAAQAAKFSGKYDGATGTCDSAICNIEYPYKNVHLGVSVEDQKQADERLRLLLDTPAAVRWASVEPLLAPVNLNAYLNTKFMDSGCYAATEQLNGIVIGGESGHGHRDMPLSSALRLALDASSVGVAVYFKQDSGPRPGMQGRVPDDIWALKEWPNGQRTASASALS